MDFVGVELKEAAKGLGHPPSAICIIPAASEALEISGEERSGLFPFFRY